MGKKDNIAPDGNLMAASVLAQGPTFETGKPQPLFQTHIVLGGANSGKQQYDVAPDGRFLINVATEDAAATPITLLLNWRPPAK